MSINIDHLEHATAGDRALQVELLCLFRSQVRDASEMIDRGRLPIDAAGLAELLHRLKGAARAVGAEPLAAGLAKAEIALQKASDGLPRQELEALVGSLQQTTSAIDALLAMRQRPGLANAGENG